MATVSWPAIGVDGFREDRWRQHLGSPDGIVEDYAGTAATSAFALSFPGGNTVRVVASAASARIDGYYLSSPTATDLTCPDPPSTTTYYLAAKFNPLLNVADPVTGLADPLGPVRLILEPLPLPVADGETYLFLWVITRNPGQALTAATKTDVRHWVGGNISAPVGQDPTAPRGTFRHNPTVDRLEVCRPDDLGTALQWREVLGPAVTPITPVAGYTSSSLRWHGGSGAMVHLGGMVSKNSGSIPNDTDLFTMPSGYRPITEALFPVTAHLTASGWTAAHLKVATSGLATFLQPGGTCDQIYVDSVRYSTRLT